MSIWIGSHIGDIRSAMTKITHLSLDERGALSRKRIHLREISGDADAPLETVGQDLRAARLRRGDDLATVSRALKIRKDHLEALEEDRFEALPGRAYAVGFVRSYSDYLGLEPRQCVERFKSEIAGRSDTQPTVGPPPDAEEIRLPQGWVVIGLVVLVILVYGGYRLVLSADSLLRQPSVPAPTRVAPPPPVPALAPKTAAAGPSMGRQPAGPAAGVASAPASALPATGALRSAGGQPSMQASAVGNTSGPAAAPGSGVAIPNAAGLPKGHVYGSENLNHRVVLRANAPTRILIQGRDGTVYLNRMLEPGDSFDVPNKVGLTLTTPNGGAVAVELDGQIMGLAGRASQMTEALSLDPQAIADRYNRGHAG